MSERIELGVRPWLPWPLSRWSWWTEPVRAERVAALRIGVGLVLLLDILGCYLPQAGDFFGRGSLSSPDVFAEVSRTSWRWSLLRGIDDPALLQAGLLVWAGSALLLALGVVPRLSAAVAWTLSLSFFHLNYYLQNSGDVVRDILLFYLMLIPSGAVWSWRDLFRRNGAAADREVYVPAWPVRLLFVQLALIYFLNGTHKYGGLEWRTGEVLTSVLGNVAWTRVSQAQLPLPHALTQVMSWTVLLWEIGFPVLMLVRPLRAPMLLMGISFHLGTGLLLPLAGFPFYMICLYLPLAPWERLRNCPKQAPTADSSVRETITPQWARNDEPVVGANR